MIIDDEDLALIADGPAWHISKKGYAGRNRMRNRVNVYERMHRLIMGAVSGQIVDHINGNKLDNRRCNLRFCTKAENNRNRKTQRNVTGLKGVIWSKRDKVFSAKIRLNSKDIHLGRFKTAEEAARAYDKAAKELFGAFARTNFTEEAA